MQLQLSSRSIPAKAGDTRHWGNLSGSANALVISQLARTHSSLVCVITSSQNESEQLAELLEYFLPADYPVLRMPDWETLPYDAFSPHQDIISERLKVLFQLPLLNKGVLVAPVSTLMQRLPPQSYISASTFLLKAGQKFDAQAMSRQLEQAGYHCVDNVYSHGEYTVRGSLMDLFPMGSDQPIRIDLFDDEIDTLRTFDPETQRSREKTDSIRILPAQEYPLDKSGIQQFRLNFQDNFDIDFRQCPLYEDVTKGIPSPGLEYYLPLFFEQTADLFSYFPDNTLLVNTAHPEEPAQNFFQEAERRYEDRRYDIQRPILSPADIFLPVEELFSRLKRFARIQTHTDSLDESKAGYINLPFTPPEELPIDARQSQPLARVEQHINNSPDRILFCAESAGRREALLELLARIGIRPVQVDSWQAFCESDEKICIGVAPLLSGVHCTKPAIELISESQLFGQRVFQSRRQQKATDVGEYTIRSLTELKEGAPVVHIDHGVGRYLGLQVLEIDQQKAEFLTLEYADGAKLYVPVASLHLISRYSGGTDDNAPLHKLGTEQWEKAKRKTAEKIRDTAAELLDIYARRAARKGFSHDMPEQSYEAFAAGFPFEETPDQAAAIAAVIKDMTSGQPMDRVICGDVGFGKTEVAMRATFVAVQSSKQVAILVPTTLLAQQHFENFRDRFADWPVQVEVLSRFKSAKEQKIVLEKLEKGQVDIIIGTHKLLQKDMNFDNLGLLIIDEEHRFGVQQKEKLKSLRSEVDILTMTATPIPRTLNMAMSGIRDLSIIATPPAKRLSVKTFVRPFDKATIKEAVLREILRGGQLYFLHNDLKTIENAAEDLRVLVPEARVGVAHGQMPERQLEQLMSDFYHKRFNVLVCSTIIETGIDIPSANTIIIERADKFGLAQLHQLRGRVGRSHHQAYAYLMTPEGKKLTSDAQKRLDAISQAEDLGSGFTLATHDMEIRGAGELLGEGQSGQMEQVGYSLYMEMLEKAVQAIKQGKTPDLDKPLHTGSEVNLRIPALIPDDYLPDVHSRLIMYKRIANARDDSELKELQVEMIDRFGLLPDALKNLFNQTKLKLKAEYLGITRIDCGPESGMFEFAAETQVEPLAIVKMVQSAPQRFKLEGASKLKFTDLMKQPESRFRIVEDLIKKLTPQSA
ncbi:transcription-repair coupling factor [Oceanospirillum sediminis]|uniref:Transcription-repair-coupling factor n=1 Tax=Oceanospirillum sediminis TaxID=2760088 RepID=A0A839IS82_9GAMM|nr:transcription-repair coupling factor [Oceanospirillum sediminis]MBB1487514.1 transcription-repair coupling factor [Oceanospirillum sediminis]